MNDRGDFMDEPPPPYNSETMGFAQYGPPDPNAPNSYPPNQYAAPSPYPPNQYPPNQYAATNPYPPNQYPNDQVPHYPPNQFPPNQYPPNQYPPNHYPDPSNYPPNQYPPQESGFVKGQTEVVYHPFATHGGQNHPTTVIVQAGQYSDVPDYMVFNIVATLMCCWIFGIIAIFKSFQVQTFNRSGNEIEARKASQTAQRWGICTIVAGCLTFFLIIIGQLLS